MIALPEGSRAAPKEQAILLFGGGFRFFGNNLVQGIVVHLRRARPKPYLIWRL